MQNYIKSQTRLAFVQYIFQNEFLNTDSSESIEDFQKHFYDTNIAIIDEKKENVFILRENLDYLSSLHFRMGAVIDAAQRGRRDDELVGFAQGRIELARAPVGLAQRFAGLAGGKADDIGIDRFQHMQAGQGAQHGMPEHVA